jgi:hypothetical protein
LRTAIVLDLLEECPACFLAPHDDKQVCKDKLCDAVSHIQIKVPVLADLYILLIVMDVAFDDWRQEIYRILKKPHTFSSKIKSLVGLL